MQDKYRPDPGKGQIATRDTGEAPLEMADITKSIGGGMDWVTGAMIRSNALTDPGRRGRAMVAHGEPGETGVQTPVARLTYRTHQVMVMKLLVPGGGSVHGKYTQEELAVISGKEIMHRIKGADQVRGGYPGEKKGIPFQDWKMYKCPEYLYATGENGFHYDVQDIDNCNPATLEKLMWHYLMIERGIHGIDSEAAKWVLVTSRSGFGRSETSTGLLDGLKHNRNIFILETELENGYWVYRAYRLVRGSTSGVWELMLLDWNRGSQPSMETLNGIHKDVMGMGRKVINLLVKGAGYPESTSIHTRFLVIPFQYNRDPHFKPNNERTMWAPIPVMFKHMLESKRFKHTVRDCVREKRIMLLEAQF